MPHRLSSPALFPQRTALCILGLAAAALLAWPSLLPAAIAGAQLAAGTAMLGVPRRSAAILAAAACAACALWPPAAPPLAALGRLLVYAGLYRLFAASLQPGHRPIATRLAQRIHPLLSDRRIAYTRAVTRLWAVFFAVQCAVWTTILAATLTHHPVGWAVWADLPPAALLLAGELAVRAIAFRGQPHGSLPDMLRALRQPAA